eukprot:scaffold80491_cov30-Phaeocystis_antarctica.AAC.2
MALMRPASWAGRAGRAARAGRHRWRGGQVRVANAHRSCAAQKRPLRTKSEDARKACGSLSLYPTRGVAASGRDAPLARNDSKTPVANQSNCTLLHSEVKTVWRVEAPTGAILPAGTLAAAVQRRG